MGQRGKKSESFATVRPQQTRGREAVKRTGSATCIQYWYIERKCHDSVELGRVGMKE